jgi:hypothetical protein
MYSSTQNVLDPDLPSWDTIKDTVTTHQFVHHLLVTDIKWNFNKQISKIRSI